MTPERVHAALVMEQAMGHITHYHNLRQAAALQNRVTAHWLPIPFEVRGLAALVPGLRSNWAARAAWRGRRALQAARSSGRIDVLLFNTQLPALFSLDVMRRVPSLVTIDATPINFDEVGLAYGHRPARDTPLDRLKHQLNRGVFHAAERVITMSDWARQSLIDDYGVSPDRVTVLASGASDVYFEIGAHRAANAPASVVGKRKSRVLFVGNDFARKGGPQLLDAMQELLAEGNCELDLVTQAPVQARPNVRIHHNLPPNGAALRELFETADVFVLPTLGECLSVALMEATAAGLPVVTTAVGALGEAVVPGESGWLVPAGDTRSLRAALEGLLGDPGRRRDMGHAGYVLAGRKFHASRNNTRLFELIYEAGSASRRCSS